MFKAATAGIGIRQDGDGTAGASGSSQIRQENQSAAIAANKQARPAASNLIRGIIYTPIGADLLLSNTKSLVVRLVKDVFSYAAPHYYMEAKNAIGGIPYIGEIFTVAGLAILVDGAIRLTIGGYRAYTNR